MDDLHVGTVIIALRYLRIRYYFIIHLLQNNAAFALILIMAVVAIYVHVGVCLATPLPHLLVTTDIHRHSENVSGSANTALARLETTFPRILRKHVHATLLF